MCALVQPIGRMPRQSATPDTSRLANKPRRAESGTAPPHPLQTPTKIRGFPFLSFRRRNACRNLAIALTPITGISSRSRSYAMICIRSLDLFIGPTYLPGLKAVIIALADDLPVFELEKHGRVRTHLRASRQSAESDCQRASPEHFDRQPVSVGHATFELVASTREQL